MLEWLVLADDRTGALEVAGELAVPLGPVPVVAWESSMPSSTALVVDLGSRHLPAATAAARAASWSVPSGRRLHKIDSTLRGRWADELVAVAQATASRVLVVAALPQLGRTCVGGVVHVDGVALGRDDARHGRVEARPAAQLRAAGAAHVAELADVAALRCWLGESSPAVAVCDATTDDDLATIAATWAEASDVVLAGTSATVAAAGLTSRLDRKPSGQGATGRGEPLPAPALVVVGSLHPMARTQVAALAAARPDVEVLATAGVDGPVDDAAAERAADALAAEARRRLDGVGTVVIVGGDTAAAVLGEDVLIGGGMLAPGIPWSRRADGSGPLIVTKAGGFGTPDTLVELLAGEGR